MRIDTYNQVAQLYESHTMKKKQNADGVGKKLEKDQVSFSSMGQDMQIAKAALKKVSDVREDKVASLKQRIAEGTYYVSPEAFADKMIAAYNEKAI